MADLVSQPAPPALSEAMVLDAEGAATALGQRWVQSPAVIVFLRHFACAACCEHVYQLAPRLTEFTRLGLRVVYVGNGAANFIEGFVERNEIEIERVEVVTDPSLRAFKAAGLRNGVASTFGPRALLRHFRAASMFGARKPEGHNLQQGGVIVIDAERRVSFHHRDRFLGDHAVIGDVIEAAMAAAGSASVVP